MFEKTIALVIDSWYSIDFITVLGDLGLKFKFVDEQSRPDKFDPRRRHYYRRWVVRGKRKQINRLIERLEDKGIAFRYW